jgi:hypothetical protein
MPQTFGNLGAQVACRQAMLLADAGADRPADPDASHSWLSGRFSAVLATLKRSARRASGHSGSRELVGSSVSSVGFPS